MIRNSRSAAAVTVAVIMLLASFYAPAVRAEYVSSTIWTGAAYQGFDPYYQSYNLHAYTAGSTVTLFITIQASSYPPGNSTYIWSVEVKIDWGGDYFSASPSPQVIAPGSSFTFKVTFAAPDTSTASNLFVHAGSIVFSESLWLSGARNTQTSTLCCYVTYSSDQLTDIRIMQRFGTVNGVGSSFFCGDLAGFTTAQADALCLQAQQESFNGTIFYSSGDFATAKTHLQNANALLNQAISSEANAPSVQNTFSIGSSWLTVFAGAISVISAASVVGVVTYILKKPKRDTPPAPTTTATSGAN